MTDLQKNEIIRLVEDEKERLGSYRAVASKCRLSEATISQLRKGSYAAEGDDVYVTIALALGFNFDGGEWKIAQTTNFDIIAETFNAAKREHIFIGISWKAGSGKTAAANAFLAQNRRNGVFKLTCREWTGRTLLTEIAREIGAEMPRGYASISALYDAIAAAVKRMAHIHPLIILDQANSLKPSALRTLIDLDNDCADILGLVAMGTENLEYEIKRGVRLNRTGYDEVDSRFGRKYIRLIGATLADARKICEANGVVDRDLQKQIFDECSPVRVMVDGGSQQVTVIEDMRRLKRIIKREKLRSHG